jgi:hypothetical protein
VLGGQIRRRVGQVGGEKQKVREERGRGFRPLNADLEGLA